MTYELTMEEVPLDPQEWKLLFMMVAENRGNIDFRKDLTPYGVSLLESLRTKLAINVVGIEPDEADNVKTEPTFCPTCKQTLIYNSVHDLDELTLRTLYGDR